MRTRFGPVTALIIDEERDWMVWRAVDRRGFIVPVCDGMRS